MTCRCPACDQVLIVDNAITPRTTICCDRCDRGFRAEDSLCELCSGHNPFAHFDGASYVCLHCGAAQGELAVALSA